jgi:PAS domain S-box-containing protein
MRRYVPDRRQKYVCIPSITEVFQKIRFSAEGGTNGSMKKKYPSFRNCRAFLANWGQAFYTLLLCLVMVIIMYISVDNFENEHLAKETKLSLTHLQYSVESKLTEPGIMLSIITKNIRDILSRGGAPREVSRHMNSIFARLQEGDRLVFEGYGLYGFFDAFGGMYLDTGWIPPPGYLPQEQPWHKDAVEANGEIAITRPHLSERTGIQVITYAQRFFDDAGRPLGMVCLDVPFETIRDYIIIAGNNENLNFGILFDAQLNVIAHQDVNLEGLSYSTMGRQFSAIANILSRDGHLFAHEFKNYQGELSIGYYTRLKNGWYIGVVQPKATYYEQTKKMALQLGIIFIFLAGVLLIVLVYSIAAKKQLAVRTEKLLDATPMVMSVWDKNGKIIDCNLEATNLFELPDKQEYLDRFYDLSPEYQPDGSRSRERVPELIKEGYEKGVYRFDWMHQKLNGEPIAAEVTIVRIPHKGGDYIVSYVRDMREVKAAMAEIIAKSAKLEETMLWYESILDAIPSAITVQDNEMKWLFINTTAETLMGKKRKDVLGKPCESWGISICGTEKCSVACAKQGLDTTYFTQEDRSYQINVSDIKNTHSEIIGYVEAIQDVTNLEQTAKRKAEAEDESRAKSAFVARISHEIRSPLNAILGVAEAQLQNKTLPRDVEEDLRLIYSSGALLRSIINDVLDFTKIEAGKVELMANEYNVGNLIADVVQLNMYRLGSKSVTFELNVDENLPVVLTGDELYIKQILNNILSNAFKYTESGKITFSARAEYPEHAKNSSVIIIYSISDTGYGMTEEQLDKLFTAYSRFVTPNKRAIIGTGLGMTITRDLVELMKGEIQVKSKFNEGSVFTVRLPQIVSDTETIGRKFAEDLKKFHFRRKIDKEKFNFAQAPMPYGSVLLVDDLETNLYVAARLLEPYMLQIDTATSGPAAIEKIKNGKVYDIIFMDHMMPEPDGIETTKIIRSLGYTAPIVALTANAVAGRAEMFLDNGFDDFVSKPIDTAQMNQILNRLIRDKHTPEAPGGERAGSSQQINVRNTGKARQRPDPQLAKIFMREAEKAAHTLEGIYARIAGDAAHTGSGPDMYTYVLTAHAMKSALANVGEDELSRLAYSLEEAGKADDTASILSKTPSFVAMLKGAIEEIRQADEPS